MPPGVVTVTATTPEPVGAVASILVFETRVTFVAGTVPNITLDPETKPVPVSVTTVPVAPVAGLIADIAGLGS